MDDLALRLAVRSIGGEAFFVGLILTCIGAATKLYAVGLAPNSRLFKFPKNILLLFGFVVTIASGTPLPLWAYAMWSATVAAAAISPLRLHRFRYLSLTLLIMASVAMGLAEANI